MISIRQLQENAMDQSDYLSRKDIRVNPESPEIGPYYIVLAKYLNPLTRENEDTNRIITVLRDGTKFDSYADLEQYMKQFAEDPFNKGKTINGTKPKWIIDDSNERYHISCDLLVDRARQMQVKVDNVMYPLHYPKEQEK